MERNARDDYFATRERIPPNDAAVFLENHVKLPGSQDAVFVDRLGTMASLEEAINQEKISDELWKRAENEKEALFALMEQVRTQLDKKNTSNIQPANLELRSCTWDRVMQEVQTTASRWSATPKRTSKLMVYLEKLGRNSDVFKSWIGVLPAGDYGSRMHSICGVFALAIGAMGQYTKVEDSILESLATIPEIIETARRYVELYPRARDHRLEVRTFELYLSILQALRHVMQFFADGSFKKVYQPFIKQGSYKNDLLVALQSIKAQAARVKDEADQCMQRRLMNMDQSLLTHGNVLLDTKETSAQSLLIMQNIYRLLVNSTAPRVSSPEISTLEDAESPQPRMLEVSRQGSERDILENRKRAQNLLDLIHFDPATVSKDIETCLRNGDAMDEQGKAKAAALIQNRVFKDFMTSNSQSESLLVNGNEDLSSSEGMSPLSLVAARLALIANQAESTYAMSYFCAEHLPYGDTSPVPLLSTLVATLVGQLTTQLLDQKRDIDLSFLDEFDWKHLKKMKLKTLCTTLEELTRQIPENSVVFCILDEMTLYETGLLRQDTDAVVRRLTRLTRRTQTVTFKFLITCRGRALEFSQYFQGHILEMSDSAEADDSSNWQIATMGT
ncbi:hypothetical protein BGZ63DRAFT_268525 [Mariannaea sp. PMI_226]|nr:hypothetical protein BGZ63DRAFT_268525 [Mariannaea sp. PMI_226]